MSYILDALRRSQAERERGGVPGLESQALSPAGPGPARRRTALTWAVCGALAGVLAAWGLLALRAPGPALPAPAVEAVTPPPRVAPVAPPPELPRVVSAPATAPMPAASPGTSPDSASGLTPGLARGPARASTWASAGVTKSSPDAAPPMAPLAAPAASARAAITRASSPPAVPSQAASVASTAAAPRTLTLAQLGPEQRRDLPTLAVGGAVWSESAANRFVLINGQVVREGDSAAPGVTLERIGPKAVWLRWRDLRLEVPL